jgi:hypothetical protein
VIEADWLVCWLQHTQGQRVKGARTSQFGEIEIIKLIYISTHPHKPDLGIHPHKKGKVKQC